jgi:CelD/BcsL family acetyltransferase involved in cellulose biosynthesis
MNLVDAVDEASWDAFVDAHPEGRFCHLSGFRRVLERAYKYECAYRDILVDGKRIGVFPSIVIRRGRGRLVSQPFNEYGGPLTETLTSSQWKELALQLLELAREVNCRSVEIRGGIGCEPLVETGFAVKHKLHEYGTLALRAEERLWRDALTNEARKGVNRARKIGQVAEIRTGPRAISGPFYHLYLRSMKRLGVPPHSSDFFELMASHLGDRLVSSWVMQEGDVAAVLLGVVSGKRIHVFAIASAPERWKDRPNDLAHWELMRWAISSGLQVFDFGSARYPGQVQFKKKWGTEFHEYSFYLIGPPESVATMRIETVKTSGQMGRIAELWKNTVPLALTAVLGPPIRKFLTK